MGAHENKMGLRLSNTTDLIFDNVRVKASSMVDLRARVQAGFKRSELIQSLCGHVGCGDLQRALDESVKYGRKENSLIPIIKFQMVQQMLADMAIKIEASRCLVNTMRMMDQGIMVQKEGSICKTFVSDARKGGHLQCSPDIWRIRLQQKSIRWKNL